MSKRYLVTGAAGFVGSAVVDLLAKEGVSLRAMVRSKAQAEALGARGVEVVVADLTQPESLTAAVEGVWGIYHIAALFRQAGLPDSEFFKINAVGTRALFEKAIAAGVQRIIHCSTVGVLGHIERPPADEHTPYNPGDVYQRSKMEGERIALEYFRSGAMRGLVLRPAMVYGPGDSRTLKLFKMIATGRFFFVGKGEGCVHFVDVRDVAAAFKRAMDQEPLSGEVYIIAGERAVPLKELVSMIAARLGVRPPRLHLPVVPMQILGSLCEAVCTPFGIQPPIFRRRVDFFTKQRHFSYEKAERELGYRPARSLNQELDEIIDSYRRMRAL